MTKARPLVALAGLTGVVGSLLVATTVARAQSPAPATARVPTPATANVSVLGHAVARGELLAADDFATEARSAAQGRGALAATDAAGKEATRNLPSGSIVRSTDVATPRLVRRGEPVNVTVRSGGLSIATAGRALGSGAAGDLVRVVITATNRTLDGIVDGPGEIRIAAR